MGGDVLGAALSTDGGDSWGPTFGFLSWEVAAFTWHPTDPRIVWAGTMSGPHVSTDGGRTWQPRRGGMPEIGAYSYSAPVQKVLFDPNDVRRLLAFGGCHRRYPSPGKPAWGAVWESRDAGHTWVRLATIAADDGGGRNVVAAAFAAGSSTVLYAAADEAGVFKSADGGRTWKAASAGLPFNSRSGEVAVNDLAVHPKDPNTLWAAIGNHREPEVHEFQPGGIFKSTDGAATWKPSLAGLTQGTTRDTNLTARYQAVAVAPTDGNVLLTSDTAWSAGVLFRSADGGATWQTVARRKDVVAAYPAGLTATVVAFSPHSADVAFAGGSEYMLRTRDGGLTWNDVTSAPCPGSQAWRGRGFSGLCAIGFRFHPTQPGRAAIVAMDHGNLWQSTDGLKCWTWGGEGMPAWGGAADLAFSGEGTIYVTLGQHGTFSGIARSGDGGRTWVVQEGVACGLPNANARAAAGGVYALPDDPLAAWAVVGGELYRTTDGGENWKVVLPGPGLRWIAADPRSPRRLYVTGDAGVYASADGAAFSLLPGSPKQANRIAVDASDPPRVYVTSWRTPHGGLWRMADGRWERLRDDPMIYDVAVDPTDPRRIALATEDHPYHDVSAATGVWLSADGGETWTQANAGLACLRGEVIAINPHDPEQVVFGTMGRGYYLVRWPKP
jgi:photosystem II stability/assembly factor-like uncharacterized protein